MPPRSRSSLRRRMSWASVPSLRSRIVSRPAPSTTIVSGSKRYSSALTRTAPPGFAWTVRPPPSVVAAAATGGEQRGEDEGAEEASHATGYYAAP